MVAEIEQIDFPSISTINSNNINSKMILFKSFLSFLNLYSQLPTAKYEDGEKVDNTSEKYQNRKYQNIDLSIY